MREEQRQRVSTLDEKKGSEVWRCWNLIVQDDVETEAHGEHLGEMAVSDEVSAEKCQAKKKVTNIDKFADSIGWWQQLRRVEVVELTG